MEMNGGQRGKNFFSGVMVLTLSAAVIKLLGFFCKIPLLHYLGSEGMGYYNTAYEVYALFCVLATAGLPVAMSVMISGSDGSAHAPRAVLRAAMAFLLPIGAGGALILYCFSGVIASVPQSPDAAGAIRAVAPAVLLISLCGGLRGYFQGRGNMVPTALSEVTEAGTKLLGSILFASVAQASGKSVPQIAQQAVYGIAVGTFVSFLTLVIFCLVDRNRGAQPPSLSREKKSAAVRLLRLSLPITASAMLVSLTRLTDMTLILRRLQDAGMDAVHANALFGSYSTLALPLFGLVPAFVSAIALPLIPNVSARPELQDRSHRLISAAVRLTAMIALPATLGLLLFSEPILSLLFQGQPEVVAVAAPLLSVLALSLFPSCLITVISAVLQAYGHPEIPLVTMAAGILIKTCAVWYLLGLQGCGMYGAPIGTLLCNLLVIAADLFALRRISGWQIGVGRSFLLPLAASAVPIGGMYVLSLFLPHGNITTLFCIAGAVILYPLFLFLFRCPDPADLAYLRNRHREQKDDNENI